MYYIYTPPTVVETVIQSANCVAEEQYTKSSRHRFKALANDPCDFNRGMAVATRQAGLSILIRSGTFSTQQSLAFTKNGVNDKKTSCDEPCS